jgi:heme oxygenase
LHDLAYFGTTMIPEFSAVKQHADTMAARIRVRGIENPVSLLGYLYVLQGTILGNQVHFPDVQRTFSIENGFGGAFYGGYGERTAEQWGIFTSLMNSIDADGETTGQICDAAQEAFGFLHEIHAALFPLPVSGSMTLTATSLNPEAGNHAVPGDEREIAAAITAGMLCR